MLQITNFKPRFFRVLLVIGLAILPLIPVHSWVLAQNSSSPFSVVRSIYTNEYGVDQPKGLAFSSTANTFLVLDGTANVALITMGEEDAGSRNLLEAQADPLNTAFDNKTNSLFVFSRNQSALLKTPADNKALPSAATPSAKYDLRALGIKDAQGVTFDSSDGHLFILDAGSLQIVSVAPNSALGFDATEAIRSNSVKRIPLKKVGLNRMSGLAYNPSNGHLYAIETVQKKLYEVTQDGSVVSAFDLASAGISNPSAMTFAPSGDTTDNPATMDLYVLDSSQTSGQIVELSLVAPATLPVGTTLLGATLVRTFQTSTWTYPSTDPSGIDYWPATGKLLIDDSEVEESVGKNPPAYWHGYNVFYSTLSGAASGNCTTFTTGGNFSHPTWNNFTAEPTGMAINGNNNHIFITNDGTKSRVIEVAPGADGQYCSPDDQLTVRSTTIYGASDSEDVAYGNNTVFISDGINAEVYVIPLGADGVLSGDDGAVTHWDTSSLGFNDLEGIGYNPDHNTLFIVSTKGTENYLGETTLSGQLVNAYDLSFMGTQGNIRSDVTWAPSSQNPSLKSIYIASRGIDNNSNRLENDGKVWEINLAGSVTSTPTFTSTVTNTATSTATPTASPTSTDTPTSTP
ncbi:MAG TPA: hypothetical protein VK206_04240, partial [Anaerolineales bacterium]|nr:hypothetical protein [Anaerolineales bacterium]